MATVLTLDRAELAFGMHPLLDRASLTVVSGERIGLIGRNGAGKSSLLGVLAGLTPLDSGEIGRPSGGAFVLVEQEPELPAATSLRSSLIARGGIAAISDDRERWRFEARLTEFLHRFGVDELAAPERLSGGERKRAVLALALALEPVLLLLDEPTNHLDIDAIVLLEDVLAKVSSAIVITHDRAFLDRVATRIVELDRGLLHGYPGNFSAFQQRKTEQLAAEELANRKFDKFWAEEEVWIRQGVKARRTRNEGRVRRLEDLRNQRAARRERFGSVRMALDDGARSGKLVAELERVDKSFGERRLVRALSLRILRGDRLGLVGPNGAGKSTLIRLILGLEPADAGSVQLGTNLRVAYFDQLRAQLDPEATVASAIAPGSDWVEIGGVRKHVISYLGDFLFSPQRANAPVKTLSGGERNRLLLARLFANPANLLVLDEPTNDLDIESLELLEDTLQSYAGTLLLVSHDRSFLDNVVTQTLVAEADGHWQEYAGGYSDWLSQRPVRLEAPALTSPTPGRSASKTARSRLSYREQRLLEQLPLEIEALEQEQQRLVTRMSEPEYHRQERTILHTDLERAATIERQLEEKFERWSALEARVMAAGH